MTYFITTTEEKSVKGSARLFRDNMWKLYKLLESVILDRVVVELIREVNKIMGIKIRLTTAFYSQIDRQTKWMNQELE